MVFDENDGGVDDKKVFIHYKRWYVYVDEKEKLIKVRYLVEVVGSGGKKVIWEVIDDHVIEEVNDNDEIGLQGFAFNLFDEDKEEVGR